MTPTLCIRPVLLVALVLLTAGCSPEAKKEAARAKAVGFFKAGDYERAEIEFKNLLQLEPQSALASEHLGLIWLERGVPWRALPHFVEARKLNPGNRELHLRMLKIAFDFGKLDEVRTGVAELLAQRPGYPDPLPLLADTVRSPDHLRTVQRVLADSPNPEHPAHQLAVASLASFEGDLPAARNALRRALALDARSSQAHAAMAAFHLAQNQPAEMARELKLAAEHAPLRAPERLRHIEHQARTGAITEATAALQDMVKQAPDYIPAWSRLAQIALVERRFDDALAHLQQGLRRDPANYECRETRAQLWLARGETPKAIAELEALARDYPGLAAPRFELAKLHLLNRDEPRARESLREALSQNPDHDAAHLLQASLMLRGGDAQGVAVALGDLLTKRPHLEPAQMLLLEALAAMSRFEEIIRILAASASRAPQNPRPHFLLGLVRLRQEKFTEALHSFEKAHELAPDLLPAVAELVKLDLQARDFPAAHRRIQAELARKPESGAAHLMLAGVHAVEGQWEQAEAALLKTIALEPGNAAAYPLLGRAILARKDAARIVERLAAILATMPDNPAALSMAGDIHLRLGRDAPAKEAYERALVTRPDLTPVLNNLAYLYAERLGQPDRALELAQRARWQDPLSPVVADTLGWILFKRKDYAGALALLQESAARLPANPEVQYHLAMASQMAGQSDAARAAFRRALAAPFDFPGKADSQARLAQLEAAAPPVPPDKGK